MVGVTDDGKLPCSEGARGVEDGVISVQKVQKQAQMEEGMRIVALLRCLSWEWETLFGMVGVAAPELTPEDGINSC